MKPAGVIRETCAIVPVMGSVAHELSVHAMLALSDLGIRSVVFVDAGGAGDITPGQFVRSRFDEFETCKVKLTPRTFSRAKMMNFGASVTRAKFLLLLDADVVLTRGYVETAADMLAAKPDTLVLPKVFYTSFEERERLRKGGHVAFRQGRSMIDEPGSVNWVHRDTFIVAGGMNTAFLGWGSEEFEFEWRWGANGRPVRRVAYPVYHLWHPRDDRKKQGYYRNATANRQLLYGIQKRNEHTIPFRIEGIEELQ